MDPAIWKSILLLDMVARKTAQLRSPFLVAESADGRWIDFGFLHAIWQLDDLEFIDGVRRISGTTAWRCGSI
jgi:hypothetical protein